MRKGGVTTESQAALRVAQYAHFERLLANCRGDTIINGDLFDGFMVDPNDVILTFQAFANWFKHVANPNCTLTLVAGNHDWNPRGGKTSSFHLLCHFMKTMFPDNVQVIDYEDGFTPIYPDIWAIPHMPNQALFDLEIEKALAENHGWLLLHANYNNTFAQHSDHSLNVSQEQIDGARSAACSPRSAGCRRSRRPRCARSASRWSSGAAPSARSGSCWSASPTATRWCC